MARACAKCRSPQTLLHKRNGSPFANVTAPLVWSCYTHGWLAYPQADFLRTTSPWLETSWWTTQALQRSSEGHPQTVRNNTVNMELPQSNRSSQVDSDSGWDETERKIEERWEAQAERADLGMCLMNGQLAGDPGRTRAGSLQRWWGERPISGRERRRGRRS